MQSPRVGIIGAGQLGRMMALAGYPLGIRSSFVDTYADSPGGQVGPIHVAALDDIDALNTLASSVDVVTFDVENVSASALAEIARSVPVHPNPEIVAAAQDRLAEKQLFREIGAPTAPYVDVDSDDSLRSAPEVLGWPIVLKARRLGYDGRGQRIVADVDALRRAWQSLGHVPAIAEGFVKFEREVSIIGARDMTGNVVAYPLTENVHADGILRKSIAPFADPSLQETAETWLRDLMARFDYVGVLAIELFVDGGRMLANEMAPRVHNSGHWTIEGAETSQFENHMRAILGLPLGSTQARGHAAMLNFLGSMPERSAALSIAGLHLHDYGKTPRPGRKLGHCTLLDTDRDRLLSRLAEVERKFPKLRRS